MNMVIKLNEETMKEAEKKLIASLRNWEDSSRGTRKRRGKEKVHEELAL
jgi:hypothetical protein